MTAGSTPFTLAPRLRSAPVLASSLTAGAVVLLIVAPALAVTLRSLSQGAGGLVAGQRDPAFRPFAADSPWNTALGDQANFAAITLPAGFEPLGDSIILASPPGPLIVVGRPVDRLVKVVLRGRQPVAGRVRVPSWITIDPESHRRIILIDSSHRLALELFNADQVNRSEVHATRLARIDLLGLGVPTVPVGSRASGLPAIAGLIRQGELRSGIRHALALSLPRRYLNARGPTSSPFVWPASAADPPPHEQYAQQGNLQLGSLLAIPPTVSLSSLGVASQGQASEIARALRDFGCYVVDTAAEQPTLLAEAGVERELSEGLAARCRGAFAALQVVTNNSPRSVAGGGKPRRPAPPKIASR